MEHVGPQQGASPSKPCSKRNTVVGGSPGLLINGVMQFTGEQGGQHGIEALALAGIPASRMIVATVQIVIRIMAMGLNAILASFLEPVET
jgi:hypothetical protein